MVRDEVGAIPRARDRLCILSKKGGSHQSVSDGDRHDLNYKRNHSSCYVASTLSEAKVEAERLVQETICSRDQHEGRGYLLKGIREEVRSNQNVC